MSTKEFYKKQELADELTCCTRTVDNLERAGLIKAMRHGRFVRYSREQVEALKQKLQAK